MIESLRSTAVGWRHDMSTASTPNVGYQLITCPLVARQSAFQAQCNSEVLPDDSI